MRQAKSAADENKLSEAVRLYKDVITVYTARARAARSMNLGRVSARQNATCGTAHWHLGRIFDLASSRARGIFGGSVASTASTASTFDGATATIALRHYSAAADLGSPMAQRTMGMIYSAGDTQMAARDPGTATTYLYFGSLGDPFAQMALGYRHLYGIDAPQQCETALRYYRAAARTALRVHYGATWVSALRRQDSAAKGAERGVGARRRA